MMKRTSFGFTLVEMIAVMAVIIVALALVTPAVSTILVGNKLTQASDNLQSQLTLARETAIAQNRQVEVRFYQYVDPSSPGTSSTYNALQAFSVNGSVYTALEKVQALPTKIIIDSGTTLSSLWSSSTALNSSATGQTGVPGVRAYSYMAVRFRPDGSTNLPPTGGPWFLTLHDALKGDKMATPPPNFITLEIDPVSGELTVFRP